SGSRAVVTRAFTATRVPGSPPPRPACAGSGINSRTRRVRRRDEDAIDYGWATPGAFARVLFTLGGVSRSNARSELEPVGPPRRGARARAPRPGRRTRPSQGTTRRIPNAAQ